MKTISNVHGLVHPDFDAIFTKSSEISLHPLQLKLRSKWLETALKVKNSPDSALFYVTVLDTDDLTKGLEEPKYLGNAMKEQDITRINHMQQLLEERFFLFPNHTSITSGMVREMATKRGISFNASELRLSVFGEYFGGGITCVENWGKTFKDVLAVPDERFQIDKALSLHVRKIPKLDAWRNTRRGKEF